MKIITDQDQFDRFVALLPELEDDQVYFFAPSGRGKYLNTTEREYYDLGRTEMFGRKIATSKAGIAKTFQALQGIIDTRTTRNGKLIPAKALVIYANINPSSTVKAYQLFKAELDNELFEIVVALQNGREPNYEGFKHLERKMMNAIQKSRARKVLIDIDIDSESDKPMQEVTAELRDHGVTFDVIKTKSGYHVVINVASLNAGKTKLHEIVQRQNANMVVGEMVFNKNQMIPVPGTMQAGKLVHFLDVK